jgi:hypothetical protein
MTLIALVLLVENDPGSLSSQITTGTSSRTDSRWGHNNPGRQHWPDHMGLVESEKIGALGHMGASRSPAITPSIAHRDQTPIGPGIGIALLRRPLGLN